MSMQPSDFVDAVYNSVYRTAVDGVIRILDRPPGREPRSDLLDLSTWYHDLSQDGRDSIHGIVRLASDQAVFGMLAVLDGVRVLAPGEMVVLLNGENDLTADHDLHDLFRARVDQELGYDL